MRNLFFALVLANLAFAAWTAWYAEPPQTRAAAGGESAVAIRLVSEVGARSPDLADGRIDAEPGGQPLDAPARPSAEGPPTAATDVADAGAALRTADAASSVSSADASPEVRLAGAARPVEASPEVRLDGASRQTDASPAVPDAAPGSAARCVSIGPFAESSDAETASERLDTEGFRSSLRSGEGEIWIGFWVHIAAIPTRAQANAMLTQLREGGVGDAYLIPGEEDGDIISLGVFNDLTRAGRLEAQVLRIGFEPVVLERSRTGTVHWIDVNLPDERPLDIGLLQLPRRIARVDQQPCEAVPAS